MLPKHNCHEVVWCEMVCCFWVSCEVECDVMVVSRYRVMSSYVVGFGMKWLDEVVAKWSGVGR